jgi:FKBP-type peptidyl-prolyl cis-trans isomerase FklB
MRRLAVAVAVTAFLGSLAATAQESKPATITNPKDKTSYALGVNIGTGLKQQGFDINPAMLAKGLSDAYTGGKILLSEQEVHETLAALQKELVAKVQERQKAEVDKNKKAGDAFLEANKKKPGVKTLPDGLQYKILKEGTGEKPTADDTVTVNYRGSLIDGTEFDSSYARKEPATFKVNGVIKGWTEILQLMPVGSKWEVYIPPALAYGDRGAGNKIGPDSVLVFEIELMSIDKTAGATK